MVNFTSKLLVVRFLKSLFYFNTPYSPFAYTGMQPPLLDTRVTLSLSLYIYIYIHVVHSISLKTFFFLQAFKIVVDSWKFSMLLQYILWDEWPIFMISASNEQLQQKLEYTLLKPDCHSWWISKMQSEEERYAIKLCFKLGKNATETYGMLQTAFGASCMNWESVFE